MLTIIDYLFEIGFNESTNKLREEMSNKMIQDSFQHQKKFINRICTASTSMDIFAQENQQHYNNNHQLSTQSQIQMHGSKEEIDRRIGYMLHDVNINPNANTQQEAVPIQKRDTCARTDPVQFKRKGTHFNKLSRINNEDTLDKFKKKHIPTFYGEGDILVNLPEGVEERLQNLEEHLGPLIRPVPCDVYTRLKLLETKVLELEERIGGPINVSYATEHLSVDHLYSYSNIDVLNFDSNSSYSNYSSPTTVATPPSLPLSPNSNLNHTVTTTNTTTSIPILRAATTVPHDHDKSRHKKETRKKDSHDQKVASSSSIK